MLQIGLLEDGEGSTLLSKAKADLKRREHSGSVSTLLKNIMGSSPIGLNRCIAKESTKTQQSEKRADIRRKERRKAKRVKKRQIHIQQHTFNNKTTTRVLTWNVQKISFAANNRGRLKGILQYTWMNKVDILLLTDITASNDGIFWSGGEERRTVIIHSKKTAIALIGIWIDLWIESGSQMWRTDRTTAILVKNYRLMSVYQPLWHYGRKTIMNYRHAIEEQIALKRHNERLIIGGDHNASIGKLEEKSSCTKARGKYGCGASNEAGKDLITWCEMNGMT